MDVGSLISGFSACFKSLLNIWKFTVHVNLENFEHYFTSAAVFPSKKSPYISIFRVCIHIPLRDIYVFFPRIGYFKFTLVDD